MAYNHVPTWWKQSNMMSFCDLYFAEFSRPLFIVGPGLSADIGTSDRGKALSLARDALANLRWHGIVTTNYDILIERAFWSLQPHVKLRVFTPQQGMEQLDPSSERLLVKLHGEELY